MILPAFVVAAAVAVAAPRPHDGMVMFAPPEQNLIVVRKSDDGKLVTGCFTNEDAARKFLDRTHRVAASAAQDK